MIWQRNSFKGDSEAGRFQARQAHFYGDLGQGLAGSDCLLLLMKPHYAAIERITDVNATITELISGYLAESLRERGMDAAILFNAQETVRSKSHGHFVPGHYSKTSAG